MLLYLDNCCFNRPFDDQQQLRISLETQAKLFIQQEILSGRFSLVWSYILEHENNKNPFESRRDSVLEWKNIAVKTMLETEEIISFGEILVKREVKVFDALHVACAYIGEGINEIHVCNPIDFIWDLEV